MTEKELVVLQTGESPNRVFPQPQVFIGAGTGLGQGILVWKGAADQGYYDVLGPKEDMAIFLRDAVNKLIC